MSVSKRYEAFEGEREEGVGVRIEREEEGWMSSRLAAMKDAVRGQRDGKERASSRMFMLKPYLSLLSRMKRKTS